MPSFLDFEKPIAELQGRIDELRETAANGDVDIAADVQRLQAKSDKLLRDTFAKLTPWQKTQVARHPERPHFRDYVAGMFEEWLPLAGDRAFADDQAILGGFATFRGRRILVIGHEKGDDTASRLRHNFGMGKPEGYRKAIRLVELADRFGLPVVTLVDTSGAFPGIQAEERGQAEAIARSTEACLAAGVPVVAAVVGEGGSGGPRQPRPARRPGWWRRVRPAQPGGHTAPVALHRRSAEVRLERGHDGTASGALADVANARWEDCVEEDVAGDVRAARRRRQRGSGKPEGP